jgi:hypothetical protein
VWNGCPEHAMTRGDAESTNQNRITLSTAVPLLSFMEEWGAKRFDKRETATLKKKQKTREKTTENRNESINGRWTSTVLTETKGRR